MLPVTLLNVARYLTISLRGPAQPLHKRARERKLKASLVYMPTFSLKNFKETPIYNCKGVNKKKSSLSYGAKTAFTLEIRKNTRNSIR